MRFKDDQGKIEESILSALDRLNQFEKDIEKSLKEKPDTKNDVDTGSPADTEAVEEETEEQSVDVPEPEEDSELYDDTEKLINENWEDIPDPLTDTPSEDSSAGAKGGELDIF